MAKRGRTKISCDDMRVKELKGIKIWHGDVNAKDTYVDFKGTFKTARFVPVYLRISCDSNYAAKVNGVIVAASGCADYPWYRNFDEIDITKMCDPVGENTLEITVWHYGENSQTYIASEAFLLFEVTQSGETLLKSDKYVLSRINNKYLNGYCKTITSQLGLSFLYDETKPDNRYSESDEHGEGTAVLRERKLCKIFNKDVSTTVKKVDGGYLIDLKKEVVGYPVLSLISSASQKITVSYSEHLTDGKVQRDVDGRDFSFEYVAKEGKNYYINPFRRIACRYMFVEAGGRIKILHVGVKKVEYPFDLINRKFDDELLQKIYDVSVYTIKCCMHEHYEDCPWREQALYALDSRNQMLCGYYMEKSTVYQRENIILMSKGLRSDGLLSLCFPAGIDYPIPFFSLCYVLQVYEYIKHTNDRGILSEVSSTLDRIMNVFCGRIADNGLIAQLPVPYWNFYEWAEDSANDEQLRLTEESHPLSYDLNLNCMFIYVAEKYNEIVGGNIDVEPMRQAVKDVLYDKERGAFRLTSRTEKMSVLGNSLAVLAGLGDEKLIEKIASGEGMIPVTLSMNTFKYDALLTAGDKYNDYIINDIKRIYGKMLDEGATTFWETELGWKDFGGAGSMCHGWSAMPVYYLCRILKGEK